MTCTISIPGFECQRDENHTGKHENRGTKENPASIKWTTAGAEREWQEFRKKQEAADPTGIGELDRKLASEYLREFKNKRKLTSSDGEWESLCWLLRLRKNSKRWHELELVRIPFTDHDQCYVDQTTGQRILTIQPYFGNGLTYNEYFALKRTLGDYLDAIRPECEKFAQKYNLDVKFSAHGWHFPGKVVLIEYTAKQAAE